MISDQCLVTMTVSSGCQVVEDYGNSRRTSSWQVLQPTFPAFHRCMPYQKPKLATSTQLCARPACQTAAGFPTKPEQVCGLASDGSNQFWLLESLGVINAGFLHQFCRCDML